MSPFLRNMRIPRQGSAAGTQAFFEAIQPQPMGPQVGALPPQLAGPPMRQATPPFPLRAGMAGAAMRPRPTASAMTPLQRDIMTKMGYGGMAPAAPKTPASGIMGRLPAVGTPAFAGLGQAAATGLQLSGYRDRPITTGEGLGAMFSAGMKAYSEAKRADLADQIALAKLREKSDFEKKLELAGIDPKSSEGQKLIREMLTKPSTLVNLSQDKEKEFNKQAVGYAFKAIGEMDKNINQIRDFEPRLEQITKMLGSGVVETGRLKNLTFPFRQIMADAGMLSDDELNSMSSEELVRQSIAFIIPRMRVVGSGSTSDKEMAMFASAAPNFANTTAGNYKISAGMAMIIKHQKERRNLMDEYMSDPNLGDGTLVGFNKWADEKQGDIFPTLDTPEKFTEAVRSGKVKEGDLIFNGRTFIVLKAEDL